MAPQFLTFHTSRELDEVDETRRQLIVIEMVSSLKTGAVRVSA
jgi:hypothetical protein